jgi:hypothetical protein
MTGLGMTGANMLHPTDAPALPARFVGAWERVELVIDGEVVDCGRAVWIETGIGFVDVRGPGGPASDTCFAGRTAWCDPYLTWTHDLDATDVTSGDTTDIGRITVVDGELLEEGAFPGEPAVRYAERWRRLDGGTSTIAVAVTANGLAVRVGDHAAAMRDARGLGGSVAARYDRWDGGVWCTELVYGDEREGDALPPPLDPTWPPPPGWSWR